MYFQAEKNLALEAARRAAELCLAVQHELLGGPERMDKDGREPVTIADFGAQSVICASLQETFPDDRVLAEESSADFNGLADSGQQAQVKEFVSAAMGTDATLDDVRHWLDHGREADSPRTWMIDPIDGTKGFLRGDQFAIAIGFAVENELALGVLACPKLPFHADEPDGELGLVAWAARGEGATVESLSGSESRTIHVSKMTGTDDARAVESVVSAHSDHDASANTFAALGLSRPPLRLDSQAKYVAVADGRAEIYLRMQSRPDYRERVWDHAAGAIIVSEASGTVTDLHGQPLDFSQGTRLEANAGVVASNDHLHQATLDALRKTGVTS